MTEPETAPPAPPTGPAQTIDYKEQKGSAGLGDDLACLPGQDVRPSRLRRIFFGADGLRAGWSFLFFGLLLVLLGRGAGFLIRHFHLLPAPSAAAVHQPMSPRRSVVGEAVTLGVVLLASWLMSLVERRPFARYGLGLRRALQDVGAGLFWGFTMLSLLIGMLLAAHAIAFDGLALHGGVALSFACKWAVAFVLVGLLEEFFTRGFIQYTVARGVAGLVRYIAPSSRHAHAIGFAVAAFLFSVCLFMYGHIHNSGESVAGIIAVGLAGAVFAFSLFRTGTLWWAIGLHAAWDWAQTFFYGVSDSGLAAVGHLLNSHPAGRPLLSGGTTGPEGSLFVIPTLLLVAVVIHYTLPRRTYPLTPAQTDPLVSEAPSAHSSPS